MLTNVVTMYIWLQVEAEVLQALHCLPEDISDYTPGHPHSLSGSSHQRTVDCGLTPISHCYVHVNRVPDSIQVNYIILYHFIDYHKCVYAVFLYQLELYTCTLHVPLLLTSLTPPHCMYHFYSHHSHHLVLHHLYHLG